MSKDLLSRFHLAYLKAINKKTNRECLAQLHKTNIGMDCLRVLYPQSLGKGFLIPKEHLLDFDLLNTRDALLLAEKRSGIEALLKIFN